MGAVFLKLLHMSIAAGWMALAVIALRFVLKKLLPSVPKAIHCALWALVALRLLLPVSVESGLSLIPEDVANGNAVSEWTNDYIDDVDIHRPNSVYYDAAIGAGREPISDGEGGYYVVTKHDQLGEPATIGNTVIPVLGWIWLGGCAVMLAYALVSFLRIRGRVKVSLYLRDNIWRCEAVDSPFILGFFRPKIYLPYHMDEEQMHYVIAHEEAHLRRRDHWWKPLGFLLLAVYWFNPLLWVAYVLLCHDIELACDERVIREMDAQEKKAYSEALLSCSVPRRMVAACPLAFGEVGVKQRIASVLHYKKPAFWMLVVAILACIAVAVGFLTNPKGDGTPQVLYEDEYVTITAPKKYAKRIKMEGVESASSLDLDFYYKPEYSLDDQQPAPENNGGWLLTVDLSTPYFKQKSGEGWVCTCWQPNDAMVYVERWPTEDSYHCSEENMEEFLAVMDAIVVTYHDLDPFSTDHIPPLVPLSKAEQDAACAALLANLRTGWWTSTPIVADKEATAFECLRREVENGQIRLYGYGAYQWVPDPYQDIETVPYWGGLTIVTLETVTLQPVEVWWPGDGAYHEMSLAENFPAEILDMLNALPVTRLYQGFSARLLQQGQQVMYPAEEVLSEAEIASFNELLAPLVYDKQGNVIGASPWSCFFTSRYNDVRELDFEQFMRYFPGDGSTASAAEVELLKKTEHWPFSQEDTLETIPVPIHKYPARLVDMILSEYAGITTADLDTSGVAYLEELDAYYNCTSDFAAGSFHCARGERVGDILYLYEEGANDIDRLTLQKVNGSYRILAHQRMIDGVAVSGETVTVEELFAVMESSPAAVSKAADYLDAHPAELEALLNSKEATLRYIFTEFLEGGQKEPHGQVMRLVLDKLVPEAQMRLYTETGQEYFDEWMASADSVATQKGLPWLKDNQPALYLALQIRSELYGHSSPNIPANTSSHLSQLLMEVESAAWFAPEDIRDITYMELVHPNGQRLTVSSEEGYTYVETCLSNATEWWTAGCPFSDVLFLHRADGVVGKILPSGDGCWMFQSNGKFYRVADWDDPAYEEDKEKYFSYFVPVDDVSHANVPELPKALKLEVEVQQAACNAILASLRTGWWLGGRTLNPVKEASAFTCFHHETVGNKVNLYGFGGYFSQDTQGNDADSWCSFTIVTLNKTTLDLVQVWWPGDGAYYDMSIEESFPEDMAQAVMMISSDDYQTLKAQLRKQAAKNMAPAATSHAPVKTQCPTIDGVEVHTPGSYIKSEWKQSSKFNEAIHCHYDVQWDYALCLRCGTPFSYETTEESYAVHRKEVVYNKDGSKKGFTCTACGYQSW